MTPASARARHADKEGLLWNETSTRSAEGKNSSLASRGLLTTAKHITPPAHRSAWLIPYPALRDVLFCTVTLPLLAKDTQGRREDSAIRDFQRALGRRRSERRRPDREDAQRRVRNNRLG